MAVDGAPLAFLLRLVVRGLPDRDLGLLPLIILMGLAMSPWLASLIPGWVDWFGGRQSARTLHFLAALALVAFVAIHVFQVIVTGFWNNLRSMITGRYRIYYPESVVHRNKDSGPKEIADGSPK